MTKDVILSIHGVQFENSPGESVEIITIGEYYFKDDLHNIIYDEISEDLTDVVNCTIKFDQNKVEIIKKGTTNVHMIFEEKKKNVTYYNTPYGDLLVGLSATKIKIDDQEDSIEVKIGYSLEINNQHISNCEISMCIKSKDKANLHL